MFYEWCLTNKLSINIKKTKVLPYYSKRQVNFLSNNQVKINGVGIECVNLYTYLGIKVDSNLSMTKHVDHLFRTALSMVFTLYKIRPYIDIHTAILIFKAHILSRVEYGSIFCSWANKSHLEKLQKLVNRSIRVCLKRPRDANVFTLHVDAKVLPLRIRRNIVLMKLMFGLKSKEGNNERANKRVVTRSSTLCNLSIPFPNTEWFRKSISYQGPSRWCNLPTELKNIRVAEDFAVHIKKWYLENFVKDGVI